MVDRRDVATPEPVASATATPLADSRVNRRQFLGGGAVSALSVAILRYDTDITTHLRESALALAQPHTAIEPARPTVVFSVARPEDLCLLDFTFYGFTLEKGSTYPSLVATAKSGSATWIGVVVQFPPQAIGEASYRHPQSPTSLPPFDPVPVLSQVAGPSRLAFTFTTGDKVPLKTGTVEDLISWTSWQLSVSPSVLSGSGVKSPESPASYQCAIEAPLDLIMSPVGYPTGSSTTSFFTNRTLPFVSPKLVSECWTTSLAATYRESIITGPERERTSPHKAILGPPMSMTPLVAAVAAKDYTGSSLTPEGLTIYDYLPPPPK